MKHISGTKVPVGELFTSLLDIDECDLHDSSKGNVWSSDNGVYSIIYNLEGEECEDLGEEFIYWHFPDIYLTTDQTEDDPEMASFITSHKENLPIRVIRSGEAESEYAPQEGEYRYDGLYFIAKYWQDKFANGVHRMLYYHFKRLPGQPPLLTTQKKTKAVLGKRKNEDKKEVKKEKRSPPAKVLKTKKKETIHAAKKSKKQEKTQPTPKASSKPVKKREVKKKEAPTPKAVKKKLGSLERPVEILNSKRKRKRIQTVTLAEETAWDEQSRVKPSKTKKKAKKSLTLVVRKPVVSVGWGYSLTEGQKSYGMQRDQFLHVDTTKNSLSNLPLSSCFGPIFREGECSICLKRISQPIQRVITGARKGKKIDYEKFINNLEKHVLHLKAHRNVLVQKISSTEHLDMDVCDAILENDQRITDVVNYLEETGKSDVYNMV